jgi:PAS domain-containing protein
MRPFKSIVAILVALAVVLGLSLASVLREQRRLMEDFTMATRQQVHASVEALSARLDALDQDTRMLTDLVERSGSGDQLEATTERLVWESAFRALVVVVAQYRTIALVDSAGSLEVLAEDPAETPDTVEALMPHTRRLALEVVAKHTKALGQTARYGSRSFLLYGTPARGGRAIVVASDAAIFLGAVAWTPLPSARLFVTDPAGVVWAGCETSNGCRATPASATGQDHLDAALARPSQVGVRGVRVVGPAHIPAVQVAERIDRPTGSWTVTWLASTQAILERERSMVSRVVLTAMAAAVAVAAVGGVVLHQQRASVELEGRLRFAQALASARETSQAIVENAPLGVLGLSQDGRVVLANRFLTDRLGPVRIGALLREALPGANAPWLRDLERLLLPEGADSVISTELRSIDTGTHELRIIDREADGDRVHSARPDRRRAARARARSRVRPDCTAAATTAHSRGAGETIHRWRSPTRWGKQAESGRNPRRRRIDPVPARETAGLTGPGGLVLQSAWRLPHLARPNGLVCFAN